MSSASITTSLLPLQTPFWFSSSSSPSCPAQILDNSLSNAEFEATYCCDGLLIDVNLPILGPIDSNNGDYCLKDLRCCSGDPNIALGGVTTCSTGTEALLAMNTSTMPSSSVAEASITQMSQGTETSTTANLIPTQTKTSGGLALRGKPVLRYICCFCGYCHDSVHFMRRLGIEQELEILGDSVVE